MNASAAIPCCRECYRPLIIPHDSVGWMICGTCKLPYAHIKLALTLLLSNELYPIYND